MAKQDSFVSKVIATKPLGTAGRYLVSFDNGETHQTSSGYVATGGVPAMLNSYVRAWVTKAGRIAEMQPITTADVERHVRALAEAEPDHVYRKNGGLACSNVAMNDREACIAGRAFVAAGIPEEALRDTLALAGANTVTSALGIPGNTGWLVGVQSKQDAGAPWGEAVARTDKEDGRGAYAA